MSAHVYSQFHQQAAAAGLLTSSTPGMDWGDYAFQDVLSVKDEAMEALKSGRVHVVGGQRLDAATILGGARKERLDARGNKVSETDDAMLMRAIVQAHTAGEINALRRDARMDALVPQASQALISFAPQVYAVRHKDLTAYDGDYLPIYRRVDRAAGRHAWYQKDLQAIAKAASTYTEDNIPIVAGPSAGENVANIMPFLVGYKVNFMDDRRSRLAVANGKPDFRINESKLRACQRVLAEAINALWLYGDTSFQIEGLLSDPLIAASNLPNGNWATATGLQIVADLTFMWTAISEDTFGDLSDDAAMKLDLPSRWYNTAATVPYTAAGGVSALQAFMDAFGLTKQQVRKKHELKVEVSQAYNGGPQNLNADTALTYYFDEGRSDEEESGDPSFIYSQPIELPAAPRQTGVGMVQFLHARAGGLRLPDARRIQKFQGFGTP